MFQEIYQLFMRLRHWLRLIPRYTITHRDIQDLMYLYAPHLSYQTHDPEYTITSRVMTDWLIGLDWTDRYPHEMDQWDCEDFANAVKSHLREMRAITGVGVVYDSSADHAYNFIVHREDGRNMLRVLEPQTDRWVQLGQGKYLARGGRVDW